MNDNTLNPQEFASKTVRPGLHNHPLKEMCQPANLSIPDLHVFNHTVKCKSEAANQKQSGRCWIFAALGMLRSQLIERDKLPKDFEFSQSYLFFWDKFEKMNWIIDEFIKTRDEDLDGRLMRLLLHDPVPDGGFWEWFVNLVEKYGLVPKSVYSESHHTGNTGELNNVLAKMARNYCRQIREGAFNRAGALQETLDVLTGVFGKPPSQLDWEYYDRDDKFVSHRNLTPIKFYKELVKIDVNDYVVLANDPRYEYGKTYGVEHINNMVGGRELKSLNITIKRMAELTKASLEAGEPLWFGCDVMQFYNKDLMTLDQSVYDYERYLDLDFEMAKADRIRFGDACLAHAMLLTGFHGYDSNVDRWQVENSWGTDNPSKGYLSMSMRWFNDHVYEVVVNSKYLTEQEREDYAKPVKLRHPPWDAMVSKRGGGDCIRMLR